jgi:hypothetical protein
MKPLAERRAIYEDDLQVRIDAAIARTQRFINCPQATRAIVSPQRVAVRCRRCGGAIVEMQETLPLRRPWSLCGRTP